MKISNRLYVGLVLGVLLAFSLTVNAGKPGSEDPPTNTGTGAYSFIGFSTAVVNGGVGLRGMNSACQADFGASARMATSVEYMAEPNPEVLNAAHAWIRPVIVAATDTLVVDASGMAAGPDKMTCYGWEVSGSSTFYGGLVVKATGSIRPWSCDVSAPVSCSAPQ